MWLSNPLVLWSFDDSLRNASAVTLGATILTPMRAPFRPPSSVVAVLGYGLLTIAWSNYSIFTTHFVLIYVATAFVAIAIAATVDARTIAQGVLLGGVLYVAASVYAFEAGLVGAAVPPGGEGFMAGVGMNRNILSYTMILALPFALSLMPRTWVGRIAWGTGTGTIFLGLYLAQSTTGFVAAVALVGAAVPMMWRDRAVERSSVTIRRVTWRRRVAPAITLLVVAMVLYGSGRDTTLSGRTPFWVATWNSIHGWERWFGAGWGVVWPHPWFPTSANEIHTEIVQRAGTFLVHGHNSFFDILPELGLVGSAIFATTYVQAAARGFRLRSLSATPTAEGLEMSRMILLGVLALLIYGVSEPLSTIPLGWFAIVVLASTLMPPRLKERDRRGRRRADPGFASAVIEDSQPESARR